MKDLFLKKYYEAEETIIKEVLRQLLKREPTLEDAKYLQKFRQEGERDKYYLAYKNMKLGTVYINTGTDYKFGFEFIPFEGEEFLSPATNENKVTFNP